MILFISAVRKLCIILLTKGMVYSLSGSSYSSLGFTGTRLSEALNTPGLLVKSVQTGDLLVVIGV